MKVNTEDELLVQAVMEALAVEPLEECFKEASPSAESQGFRRRSLLVRRTGRLLTARRPPCPQSLQTQLSHTLSRSRTVGSVGFFSAVLKMQWLALNELQALLRSDEKSRASQQGFGRVASALDFFFFGLQIQQWFRPEKSANTSPAADGKAREAHEENEENAQDEGPSEEGAARARLALDFLFAALSQLLLPSAADLKSLQEKQSFLEALGDEALLQDEASERLRLALAEEVGARESSPPMHVLRRAWLRVGDDSGVCTWPSAEIRLISAQTFLLQRRKAAWHVLALLFNITATACRVSPAVGAAEGVRLEKRILSFLQMLLELLPAAVAADAAESSASHNNSASAFDRRKAIAETTAQKGLPPLTAPLLQALRSCASWLSRREVFLRSRGSVSLFEPPRDDPSTQDALAAFVISQLDLAVVRAFSLSRYSEGASLSFTEEAALSGAKAVVEEVERLSKQLFPETHPAHR